MKHDARTPDERRRSPRKEAAPIRWRDIARRSDRENLPFLRYFEELARAPLGAANETPNLDAAS